MPRRARARRRQQAARSPEPVEYLVVTSCPEYGVGTLLATLGRVTPENRLELRHSLRCMAEYYRIDEEANPRFGAQC